MLLANSLTRRSNALLFRARHSFLKPYLCSWPWHITAECSLRRGERRELGHVDARPVPGVGGRAFEGAKEDGALWTRTASELALRSVLGTQ